VSDEPTNGNRPTMRDVVDLVTDTRRELSDSISTLGDKFDAFVTTNEHRLTVVEMYHASQAADIGKITQRLTLHGEEIGHLKDRANQDEAITRALQEAHGVSSSRWASRGAIVATLSSIVVAVSLIVAFFH